MSYDLTSNLTMEQLTALDELKRRTGDEVNEEDRKDDALFLRFLRARDYNVNRAETMLKNDLDWREKMQLRNIKDFVPPKVEKYFPFSEVAKDMDGSPILYLDIGNMDLKGILKSTKKQEALKTVVQRLESCNEDMKKTSEKKGKLVETWTILLNFENYSLTQATHKQSLEFISLILMTYEAHYPERLKYAYIINASIYFTILFAVVKPLLHANTVKKIKIFGKEGYQQELRKMVNPDGLPAFLGGNKTDKDGDPRCISYVKHGSPVPPEMYFRSAESRLAYQPGVKKYSVARKSSVNVVLDVDEPGSQIEWEFETESRDIIFGLYYKESDEDTMAKPKELIPKQRVEAHIHKETGIYRCDSPGTYILLFDNSYSWLSQKEIFCRASVTRPVVQHSQFIMN